MTSSIEYATQFIDPALHHVVELGVYTGTSIRKLRERVPSEKQIFGFDSFEGLPEDWKLTPCAKGWFSTDGVIPDVPGVTFYKGWFEDTLPQYVAKEAKSIALLHIDCDLYSSTTTAFNLLHPFIKVGTILAFDEWCYNHDAQYNDHEQKAFYEYVDKHNISFEFIEFNDPDKNETKIVKITGI